MMVTAAYWLASRACHRVLTGTPIVELALGEPAQVFDSACHAVQAAITARDTVEPPTNRNVTGLLVAAESVRRCGELPAQWLRLCTEITGTPWPAHLSGRAFVAQRWTAIERVAAELLYERRAAVSRMMELCGVNVKEFA
jgi:hypothetical protein